MFTNHLKYLPESVNINLTTIEKAQKKLIEAHETQRGSLKRLKRLNAFAALVIIR